MIYRFQTAFIGLLGVLLLPAYAAQTSAIVPLVQLNAVQAGNFSQAATALAEKGKIVLVAEGVPLHPLLSPKDTVKLTMPLAVNDAVKALADAYDYSAQREGNIFVLRKRYSEPDDLPALTQAEVNRAFLLLQQVSEPFNPHALSSRIQYLAPPSPTLRPEQIRVIHPLVDAFAASLTPEQLEAMQHNKLLISSLSPNQKTLAWKLRLSLYIQLPMDSMSLIPPILKQAEKNAVFCRQDIYSFPKVFGYTLPEQIGDQSQIRFHPLSRSTGLEDFNTVNADPQPTGSDPTDPSAASMETKISTAQTLADVVEALNAHSGGTVHALVDPLIGVKPVTLVGMNNAPVSGILHALSDVYGLRLSESAPGSPATFTLTLPDVPLPLVLAALPSSLRQTLPEPFVRAIHLETIVSEEQQFYTFWQSSTHPNHATQAHQTPDLEETSADLAESMLERKRTISSNTDFHANLEKIKHEKMALSVLRIAAIRRLRRLVEPKIQTKPTGIAITELGEQEHEALATILLIEAVQALGDLITQAVPDTALHFEDAKLSGGIQETSHPISFVVEFHMPNPPGGLEVNGGDIGVPYNKDYGEDNKL